MDNKRGTRIHKALSDNGIMSRRKAEEAIEKGRIRINGHRAGIGQRIDTDRDVIAIDGVNVDLKTKIKKIYVMLNKPRGYVTTTDDELGRKHVMELLEGLPRVYPVGRLDRDSEGLLLFTNDGDFAEMITHPARHVSKTYRVTVRPEISDNQAAMLSGGVMVDGVMTAPAKILVLEKEQGRSVLQISIREGRNRQIRKMCESAGLEVARLRRTAIGPLKLGMLRPGQWRELTPSEVGMLRNAARKTDDGKTGKPNERL